MAQVLTAQIPMAGISVAVDSLHTPAVVTEPRFPRGTQEYKVPTITLIQSPLKDVEGLVLQMRNAGWLGAKDQLVKPVQIKCGSLVSVPLDTLTGIFTTVEALRLNEKSISEITLSFFEGKGRMPDASHQDSCFVRTDKKLPWHRITVAAPPLVASSLGIIKGGRPGDNQSKRK